MSEYPPGTPAWVELGSPDPEAALAFYTGLFGWRARRLGQPQGDRAIFELGGRAAAALGPPRQAARPAWTTYVSVADAGGAAARVAEAGGSVLVGPVDVEECGRLAVVADLAGAVIGCWEPGSAGGAGVVNRPGSFCWNELATRDTDAAVRFYHALFDWHAAVDPGIGYTEWKLVDRPVAGMFPMSAEWPAGVPAHWMVYFAVADCDRAASGAVELGGRLLQPPGDIPPGRFAVIEDPQGAIFSTIALDRGRAGGERAPT